MQLVSATVRRILGTPIALATVVFAIFCSALPFCFVSPECHEPAQVSASSERPFSLSQLSSVRLDRIDLQSFKVVKIDSAQLRALMEEDLRNDCTVALDPKSPLRFSIKLEYNEKYGYVTIVQVLHRNTGQSTEILWERADSTALSSHPDLKEIHTHVERSLGIFSRAIAISRAADIVAPIDGWANPGTAPIPQQGRVIKGANARDSELFEDLMDNYATEYKWPSIEKPSVTSPSK